MTDPALVARFRGDLAKAFGREIAAGERIALAVSGGPDSMAMLALAAAAFPGQVIVATVDHRTRPATAAEAVMVARYCAGIGVPYVTLTLGEPLEGTALHERARIARYDLLARWALDAGAALLATAHHADDQAETFLMRAVRGSGPAGLSGIRARQDLTVRRSVGDVVGIFDEWRMPLVRPLLDWRRTDLRALVEQIAIPFVEDPSNTDDRFERSRVRKLLADAPWLDPGQIARAAAHVGEAHAALEAMSDWLGRTRRIVPPGADNPDDQHWLDMTDLPRELKRRLAREAIRWVRIANGIMPDFDLATNIEPLLDSVEAGRAATQAAVLVSRKDGLWHFREAPPRRSPHRSI